MSDLRFGRSETNIRMVRTFASFFSDQIIVLHVHSCLDCCFAHRGCIGGFLFLQIFNGRYAANQVVSVESSFFINHVFFFFLFIFFFFGYCEDSLTS